MIYGWGRQDLLRARQLLELVGLADLADHRPNELSGGQQQRVAIARALANAPQVIFADEPTGNLDSTSEMEIMEILSNLNQQGITVVLVTHEPEISRYVRRIIRMRDGKVQADERQHGLAPSASQRLAPPSPLQKRADGPFRTMTTKAFSYWRQALRALLANKVRTALSMLGILIGVAAIIAILAVGNGAKDAIQAQLSSLGSNLLILRSGGFHSGGVSLGAGSVARIGLDDAEAVKILPMVKRVSPAVSGRAQLVFEDKNWSSQIYGVGIDYQHIRASVPTMGRFFTADEINSRARVAVVGSTVVKELFGDKNPLGSGIRINRIAFQVIGILPVKGSSGWGDQDDTVLVPITTAMRRLLGRTNVDSVEIEVKDPEDLDRADDAIQELMNQRHHIRDPEKSSFFVRNMADIQEAVSGTSRILSLLLAAIASISLVVGGIGIMNIMLVSVTERTREIGLRKALGATGTSIQSQFLIEAILVSSLGGGLGILCGVGVSLTLASLAGWATRVTLDSVLMASLFSSGVGILFGYWPARKASLLNPIDALRHE
jgi:macrolide transport system ATP-binding/permease protein